MVECPIPQDILKYKSKFIASLSVRETVFGGLGVGLGLWSYFGWTKGLESQDLKMFISFLVILPFFLIGFVKLYDQPFEKIAMTLVIENFIYPLKRKKEVHFREFEKYENTRDWMRPEEDVDSDQNDDITLLEELSSEKPIDQNVDSQNNDNSQKDKKAKTKKKKTPQKVTVQKSETYKGIK